MRDKPIRQDELADWLTSPMHGRFGGNAVYVPVRFFKRMEDGTIKSVSTAGYSQAVPVTFMHEGFDWDMNRTFMDTPVTLYADYEEWLEWLQGGGDG